MPPPGFRPRARHAARRSWSDILDGSAMGEGAAASAATASTEGGWDAVGASALGRGAAAGAGAASKMPEP